ncbi:MAG: hypothetical protein CVT63_02600 [Candidatus Anoxymicrobium japonicum]|uniref:DNA-binding response regulator n=1 Tax=Candidatus Anoxymicrobium japonicum TaxID=2013648 RepID=A0A2N3G6Y6_9ACTN|nr:MAG: hypothetical protein CVT63_02600 [Candidatus Anoxymicrobium japonicum]
MPGDKQKVLIVEDEPLVNEMITKSLRLEGYQVESARTGEEGLAKAKDTNPDLVLLDILLPKIDGWEVLTKMRDNSRTRGIPIIMLTALADEKSKVQGLRGGADDYITKPFSALELIARVETVLKRSGRGDARTARSRIPVRESGRTLLLDIDDINFVNVQREYTYLYTDSDRYLTNHTLGELEKMLDPAKFFRTHRGYIANLQKVKEIMKVGVSSYEITMSDPARSKIPMSRRQRSELKKILDI